MYVNLFAPVKVCKKTILRIAAGLLALALVVPVPASAEAPDIRRDATVAAIQKVLPSVVNIATETLVQYHDWYDDLLRQFYGWSNTPLHQEKSYSLGSGVIIDDEGYVLTNFHVVRRANRIQVKLWDGREYDADPIVYTEMSDIALLKIRAKPGEKFKAIKFAADDDLLLGETVLALGDPFGLGGSVTRGILSSKNRRPATGNEPLNVEDWLQTDAAINPGNSGGPLVDLRGELIGLNVAVYREQSGERGMGVGFSIPVKQISAALSRFFTPELTDSLWFGARVKMAAGRLVVASVQPGSPADDAGLAAGDDILRINQQPAASLITYNRLLHEAPQHKATLLIERDGREKELRPLQLVPFVRLVRQRLGLTLLGLTQQDTARLGLGTGKALFIDEVKPDSPAAEAAIKRGYLLTAIDGHATPDLHSLCEVLTRRKKGDPVRLSVIIPQTVGDNFVELRQGTATAVLR